MTKKILTATVTFLMITLVACQPLQNEGQIDWATVDLSVDSEHSANYLAQSAGVISTALIIAVPVPIGSVDHTAYITDFYSRGLLDLSSSSVELSLPLNIPMCVVQVTFTGDLSLDQIISNQPPANTIGISEPVTIDSEGGTVSVSIVLSSPPTLITAFEFPVSLNSNLPGDISGSIDETNQTIILTVPFETDVSALVATFTATGESVAVNGTTQVSGTAANDFSSSVIYTVTAAGGSTQDYIVLVSSALGVSLTSPADGDNEVDVGTAISATFSMAIDPSTVSTNTDDTSCSGTIQLSDDGFGSCIQMSASPTASFGDTVFTVTPASDLSYNTAYSLKLTTDIAVTAAFALSSAYTASFTTQAYLATSTTPAYLATGTLDATFNGVGYLIYDAGIVNDEYGYDVAIDSEGRILVTGSINNGSDNDMVLMRYTSAGVLDPSFGSGGIVTATGTLAGADEGKGIAIDSNGKILVAGTSYNTTTLSDMTIWRYNSDGTLDTSFAGSGVVTHDGDPGNPNSTAYAYGIAIDDNGNIFTTGSIDSVSTDMAIWKYKPDGTLETAFDSDGLQSHDSAGSDYSDYGRAIAVDANGKVLIVGTGVQGEALNDVVVWKYDAATGQLDPDFNPSGASSAHPNDDSGFFAFDLSNNDSGNGVAIDADNNIVVVSTSNNSSMFILRITPAGALDTSFNSSGFVVVTGSISGSSTDHGFGLVIDAYHNILVTGEAWDTPNGYMMIWRYDSSGNLDTSFGTNGIANISGAGADDSGDKIVMDEDGKIVVVGYGYNGADYDLAIWRYK
jgi:uncharacterized delta-60 repeat protein